MTPESQKSPIENRRLLIVDDEPAVLRILKTILLKANYSIVSCNSAEEAIKALNERSFDCVITDAIMPGTNGYEMVKNIRKEPFYGDIPILMLTRKRHRKDVKLAVDAGVTDYVIKPIDDSLLLDKVELCLTKGSGRRHTFESVVQGEQSAAQLSFHCQINSISESYVTISTAHAIAPDFQLELKTRLFEEIGIKDPLIKLVSCIQKEPGVGPFQSTFSFMGVLETDLSKIRVWLRREEIKRRK